MTNAPLAACYLWSEGEIVATKNRYPLKRIGKQDDFAEMVALLLSKKISCINEQIIDVDGGISLPN